MVGMPSTTLRTTVGGSRLQASLADRSGIVGAPKELNLESRRDSLEKPRSSRDVVHADDLRSVCCAISPEDAKPPGGATFAEKK